MAVQLWHNLSQWFSIDVTDLEVSFSNCSNLFHKTTKADDVTGKWHIYNKNIIECKINMLSSVQGCFDALKSSSIGKKKSEKWRHKKAKVSGGGSEAQAVVGGCSAMSFLRVWHVHTSLSLLHTWPIFLSYCCYRSWMQTSTAELGVSKHVEGDIIWLEVVFLMHTTFLFLTVIQASISSGYDTFPWFTETETTSLNQTNY